MFRLGLLDHPTSVGLRYGKKHVSLRIFSRKQKLSQLSPDICQKIPHPARLNASPHFAGPTILRSKRAFTAHARKFLLVQSPVNNDTSPVAEYKRLVPEIPPPKLTPDLHCNCNSPLPIVLDKVGTSLSLRQTA